MLGVEQQTANAQSITSTVLSSTKQYACSEKEKLESHTIIVERKGSNDHYDFRPKARICLNPPCCYTYLARPICIQLLESLWSTAAAIQHSRDMRRFVTAQLRCKNLSWNWLTSPFLSDILSVDEKPNYFDLIFKCYNFIRGPI